jgi:hypothetical protein
VGKEGARHGTTGLGGKARCWDAEREEGGGGKATTGLGKEEGLLGWFCFPLFMFVSICLTHFLFFLFRLKLKHDTEVK